MTTVTEPTTSEFLRTQRSDHDTLVRLETIMEQVAKDIKDFSVNIASHDSRIRRLEAVLDQYPPGPLVVELRNNTETLRDLRTSYRVATVIAGFVGSAVMFAIGLVTKFLGFIK